MKTTTNRQKAVMSFIIDYIYDRGFPPSIREIGNHFKIGSLRGVTVHLDALEKKGYIKRWPNSPRSIQVLTGVDGNSTKRPFFLATVTGVLFDEKGLSCSMQFDGDGVREVGSRVSVQIVPGGRS